MRQRMGINLVFTSIVLILLTMIVAVGVIGCISNSMLDDATFAANAFTSSKSVSIILKKTADLANDIHNIQCGYDLEYGTDAYKNQNNLGRWEAYLLEKLQEITTNKGRRVYLINKERYKDVFEVIYKE